MQRRNVEPWDITHRLFPVANGQPGGVETVAAAIRGDSDTPSATASVFLAAGDSETRPKNAYVNYIIKY